MSELKDAAELWAFVQIFLDSHVPVVRQHRVAQPLEVAVFQGQTEPIVNARNLQHSTPLAVDRLKAALQHWAAPPDDQLPKP